MMQTRRRILSWVYVSLFILYLLALFTDDTLRVPHPALHQFRQYWLVPLFFLPMILLYTTLRR